MAHVVHDTDVQYGVGSPNRDQHLQSFRSARQLFEARPCIILVGFLALVSILSNRSVEF